MGGDGSLTCSRSGAYWPRMRANEPNYLIFRFATIRGNSRRFSQKTSHDSRCGRKIRGLVDLTPVGAYSERQSSTARSAPVGGCNTREKESWLTSLLPTTT